MSTKNLIRTCIFLLSCTIPAAADTHQRFAWLANDPNNTYDAATLAGIRDIVAPIKATVDPFYAGFDPATQLTQCHQAIVSGLYTGLFVEAADAVLIEPCVAEARTHHIPVVATDLPIGPDNASVQPQVPNEVGASFVSAASWGTAVQTIAPQICQGLNPCNVLYLAGDEALAIDILGIQALKNAIKANPSIFLIAEDQAFYDTGIAQQVVTAQLMAHPVINVVIAAGDQMAQGAEQAAAALGRKIQILGGGAGTYAIQAVKDGRWFGTFNALPRTEGQLGAGLMELYLFDHNVKPIGLDPVVVTGLPTVWTKATLAQHPTFKPQW